MAIIDTSNTIDSSIFLKAKLKDNMVGDNYYIENIQARRNRDWDYRFNRVDIEEELERQYHYTKDIPVYTPIEVVINNVKSEKGEAYGSDWSSIAFKDLKHPFDLGSRYRFSTYNFEDPTTLTEEEKHYDKSIWICVNRTPVTAGNSGLIRRCNSTIAFNGSTDLTNDKIVEHHFEPCIIETEMKFIQTYNNKTVPIPQSEFYVIMQCNYFTNFIKTNDRIIVGTSDLLVRENNYVYKVKAVVKTDSKKTFNKDAQDLLESTNLIILALDRDLVSPNDDFINRIAFNAPIYKVEDQNKDFVDIDEGDIKDDDEGSFDSAENEINEYSLVMDEDCEQKILWGEECEYRVFLKYKDKLFDSKKVYFNYEVDLKGIKEERQSVYYEFVNEKGSNIFKIKNKKQCKIGKLNIVVKCYVPTHEDDDKFLITNTFEFELGGIY